MHATKNNFLSDLWHFDTKIFVFVFVFVFVFGCTFTWVSLLFTPYFLRISDLLHLFNHIIINY